MWNRTEIDKRKVQKIWWLDEETKKYFRKNRKKCSCISCKNPRKTGFSTGKGNKEKSLTLLHADEVNEALFL